MTPPFGPGEMVSFSQHFCWPRFRVQPAQSGMSSQALQQTVVLRSGLSTLFKFVPPFSTFSSSAPQLDQAGGVGVGAGGGAGGVGGGVGVGPSSEKNVVPEIMNLQLPGPPWPTTTSSFELFCGFETGRTTRFSQS